MTDRLPSGRLSDRLAARGLTADYKPLTLAQLHQEHYRSCGCLGDSAECCVPSCACHDAEPLTVDLRDPEPVEPWPWELDTELSVLRSIVAHHFIGWRRAGNGFVYAELRPQPEPLTPIERDALERALDAVPL